MNPQKGRKKSPEKNSLGDFFALLPFSDEERKRIADLALSDSLPREILFKYGPQTRPYKEVFEKRERIPGFRPGSDAYNQKAIPRLIEYLGNPSRRNHEFCWEIYRSTAIKYVTSQLSLNKLFSEIKYDGAEHDAKYLLKSVCTNAFDYKVTTDTVRALYEVWWIDRIDNLDELLQLCSHTDEARAQKKLVAKLSDDLEILRTSFDELVKQTIAQNSVTKEINDLVVRDKEKLRSTETAIQAVPSAIAEATAKLTKLMDARFETVEETLESITAATAALKKQSSDDGKIKNLQAEMVNLVEVTGQALASSQENFSQMVTSETAKITTRLDELEQALAALATQIATQSDKGSQNLSFPAATSFYRSPLSAAVLHSTPSFKITKETDFLNSWSAILSRNHKLMLSIEELVAYHALLLANHVIIIDYTLAETWIDCVGWRHLSKDIVASPLWAQEQDWSEGAEHLFKDESGTRPPRVLIIHNYDAGVVDCYLVPTLILWALRLSKGSSSGKLFLIPSQPGAASSHRVLEHAACIDRNNQPPPTKLRFEGSAPTTAQIRGDIATGVDPRMTSQWLQSSSKSSYDLTTIEKPFNLQFTDRLISNFQNTVSYAGKFFKESSAAGVGVHHHILPWVRSANEATYEALRTRVSELPDIVY